MKPLLLALLVLTGCADNCPDSEKLKVAEVEECFEAEEGIPQDCIVKLEDGSRARILSPVKVGELVCP